MQERIRVLNNKLEQVFNGLSEHEIEDSEPQFMKFLETRDLLEQLGEDLQCRIQSFHVISDNIHSVLVVVDNKPNVKLPKFNLLTFNGVISKWLNFKQIFETTIPNNRSLSGTQKLQYLHSVVSADATRLKGFPLTEENYLQAWETLTNCFDNGRAHIFFVCSTVQPKAHEISFDKNTTSNLGLYK